MSEQLPATGPARSVVDYYDQMAEDWDQSHGSGRQNPHFARQIRKNLKSMLANIAGNAQGLEIGAGTGPYIDVTAPLVGHLTATDLSDGMLRVMERRVAALGLSNVTVMRADACKLDNIEANSIDVVYSIGLLETVPDLARVFSAVYRVLKPGGIVAGITSNGGCPWYTVRRWLEGGERHGRTGRLATGNLLDELLSSGGFEPPHIRYWAALPPSVQSELLGAVFAAVEAMAMLTPLGKLLGVITFRSRKLDRPS